MTQRLDVNAGETYTISSGVTEEWLGADVDGTLEVNGTLLLIDDAEPPTDEGDGFDIPDTSIDLPVGIDLPSGSVKLTQMQSGVAILFVGLLAVVLAAAALLRNYAAGALWSVSIIVLLLSGTLGLSIELFYIALIAAMFAIGVGLVVRWA